VGVCFRDAAAGWGLTRPLIYGHPKQQKYILESTGSGAAAIDYDNDGRPDLFLVNGARLSEPASEATSMLYHNEGVRFVDVSARSGVARNGWGQGVCLGDYDNDGWTDLYVTYYGHNVLYRNRGDGTFEDRSGQTGVRGRLPRWGAGCAFTDYDRDGDLDLFVANYVAYEDAAAHEPGSGPFCTWKGLPIMCGPRGLKRDFNLLYRNNGDGTFSDVSQASGIRDTEGHYCFQPVTADFDNDGWPDIYVTCDSTPNILYHNLGNGTFRDDALASSTALSGDGNEQAGMGVAVADFDGTGRPSILVTNFADDTPTLYRNLGDLSFSDVTLASGLGRYRQYLGWGAVFLDYDNDAWEDLFMANGHISSAVEQKGLGSYRQARLLYRNQGNGTFLDVTASAGSDLAIATSSRGAIAEDFNNDGRLDLLVTVLNEPPSLLLNQASGGHWVILNLTGTRSNRSAVGAKVELEAAGRRQIREVRSSSSFYSSSGLRLHFGLGRAERIERIRVRWPSGAHSELLKPLTDRTHSLVEP
jgi:hypothetical protein